MWGSGTSCYARFFCFHWRLIEAMCWRCHRSLSPTGDRRERPQFIFDKAGKPVAMTSGMARDWDSAPLRRNGAAARG